MPLGAAAACLPGPSRFALINNTARQLLEEQGYISAGGADRKDKSGNKGKK